MACNWHVITCHYMHYMPLHAIEDANGIQHRTYYIVLYRRYDVVYDGVGHTYDIVGHTS